MLLIPRFIEIEMFDPNAETLPIIGEELIHRYSSGDIVVWIHDIKTEKTGIILEIYNQRLSNRLFPCAKIYVMGEERHEEVLLSSLRNISKN